MILPIYAFGHPVLKKLAETIPGPGETIEHLIADMWETMYHAHGVGLAAPQVGQSLNLFIVDTLQLKDEEEEHVGIKKVFINAQMIDEYGEEWAYEEGCLSIPKLTAEVERNETIRLRYMDENFINHEENFDGYNARVIQHEYDHIRGILFVDRLKPLKKRMIQRRLNKIRNGEVDADYAMRFKP